MEHLPRSEEKKLPPKDADLDELIQYFDAHPEDIRSEYLNNFYTNAPRSGFLAQFENFPHILDRKPPQESPRNTDLRKGKTKREFFEVFAQALAETPEVREAWDALITRREDTEREIKDLEHRIETEEMSTAERLQLREHQIKLFPQRPTSSDYNRVLLPLYNVLRKKGYSHYDLIQ